MIANLDGTELELFTFRPANCAIREVLLVFHGYGRDPSTYRDDAVPAGQRLCLLVIAPLFDAARFPDWRYQLGGIVRHGTVESPDRRTVALIPRLIAWARAREGRAGLAYSLIGHSAGGQFLGRVAAFQPNESRHTVIVNPSTWVRARLDIAAPFGFGGVYDRARAETALRTYLASPITVLLGEEDVGSVNLSMTRQAQEQGKTRLERGENAYREAQATARQHGWTFNWRLAEVPGIGHSARGMLSSSQAIAALSD